MVLCDECGILISRHPTKALGTRLCKQCRDDMARWFVENDDDRMDADEPDFTVDPDDPTHPGWEA